VAFAVRVCDGGAIALEVGDVSVARAGHRLRIGVVRVGVGPRGPLVHVSRLRAEITVALGPPPPLPDATRAKRGGGMAAVAARCARPTLPALARCGLALARATRWRYDGAIEVVLRAADGGGEHVLVTRVDEAAADAREPRKAVFGNFAATLDGREIASAGPCTFDGDVRVGAIDAALDTEALAPIRAAFARPKADEGIAPKADSEAGDDRAYFLALVVVLGLTSPYVALLALLLAAASAVLGAPSLEPPAVGLVVDDVAVAVAGVDFSAKVACAALRVSAAGATGNTEFGWPAAWRHFFSFSRGFRFFSLVGSDGISRRTRRFGEYRIRLARWSSPSCPVLEIERCGVEFPVPGVEERNFYFCRIRPRRSS